MECRRANAKGKKFACGKKTQILLGTILFAMNLFAGKIFAQEALSLPKDILKEALIAENEMEEAAEKEKAAAENSEEEFDDEFFDDDDEFFEDEFPEDEDEISDGEDFEIENEISENENFETKTSPENEGSFYLAEDEDKNPMFVQKLSWKAVTNAKNYKIEIQKLEEAGFKTIFEKELVENAVEISLEHGKYRFQISVQDVFDQKKSSGWREFEILQALPPKINDISPRTFSLNKKDAFADETAEMFFYAPGFSKEDRKNLKEKKKIKMTETLAISGENLLDETFFVLRKIGANDEIKGNISSIDENPETGEKIVLMDFNLKDFSVGEYSLYARNPGGLSDTFESIEVELYKRKIDVDLMVSAGYVLPIALYDKSLAKYAEKNIFPASANAKIAILPWHKKFGNFGIGLNANYSNFKNDAKLYTFAGNHLSVVLNAIFQRYIIDQVLGFDVHAGIGMGMVFGCEFKNKLTEIESPKMTALGLEFAAGFAVQYYPIKHLYLEVGLDFVHTEFMDTSFGRLYPSVSVGGMF
ncbi:MAG: hypothetical protein K2N58_03375 [Treponemataceae bacterium]|nr:hypothetical protein [Treponemataceae bacterium]